MHVVTQKSWRTDRKVVNVGRIHIIKKYEQAVWNFWSDLNREALLVVVIDRRSISANCQFSNKQTCKNREEVANIQGHDCQHATDVLVLAIKTKTANKLTVGSRVLPGQCRCMLWEDR